MGDVTHRLAEDDCLAMRLDAPRRSATARARPRATSWSSRRSARARRGDERDARRFESAARALGEREIAGLSDVLIDCVEGGASVSFMLPMSRAKAEAYWRDAAASVARGERVVLAAEDERGIVGTVQVDLGAARESAASRRSREDARASARAPPRHRRGAARRRRARGARRRQDAAGARHRERRSGALVRAARLAALGEIPRYALLPDGSPCARQCSSRRSTSDAPPPGANPMQIVPCTYESHAERDPRDPERRDRDVHRAVRLPSRARRKA